MPQFYHSLFRKAIIIFGSRFNDLYITRSNDAGVETQDIKVPITYGPREKFLARVDGDKGDKRDVAIQLPQISFEITGMSRQTGKVLNKIHRIQRGRETSFVGVPYQLDFEMNIMTKNMEDALQIVEQILPYFNPHVTFKCDLLGDGINTDVPLEITSVSLNDAYEGNFQQRRVIIFTLTFSMGYHFFGPVQEAKVIKFANIGVYSMPDMTGKYESVTVQPGLTSNGEPTTDINETIPYQEINIEDDYGFVVRVIDE